jgi:limonene 1,2-monooxygenase
VAVASAVTPSGGRLAGRYDLGMLCVAAGDRAGFNALDVNWAVAQEVAAEHGRTMDPSRLRLVVSMHLADTREQAHANVRFGLKEQVDYFNNNMPRIFVPEGADTVDWYVEQQLAVIGTPADAIARIEQLIDKQGDFGAVLIGANNWADWDETKRSYELYARYVMPHFSGANRARVDSYDWVTKHTSELSDLRRSAAQAMIDRHEVEWQAKHGDAERPDRPGRPERGGESSFG